MIVRKSIMPLIFLALIASNFLTLFNASFYDGLYATLARVMPMKWRQHSKTSVLQQKKAKIKSITQRVKKRTIRNISANIAALPGEAIPIVGTAVVVAITVMDLKDACDDMKDMDRLMDTFSLMGSDADSDKVCGLEVPQL